MGTEWYTQAYSNGEEQFVEIQSVLSRYQTKVEEKRDVLVLTLPEDDVDMYMDLSSDKVSGLMISRPLVSATLDRVIYEIMQCGRFVFYAPDAAFPIALSPDVTHHLPEDMLNALGKPEIADSLEHFSYLLDEMYAQGYTK